MIENVKRQDTFGMFKNINLRGIYSIASAFSILLIAFFSFPSSISAQNTNAEGTASGLVENEPLELTGDTESSSNFGHIITAEQLLIFSDRTIEEAMARIPGVQRGRYGQFNIRGTSGAGRGLYNVTINGQRMASTGKGHRSIDLGTMSTDMAGQLEVVKVLTPDRDADALGGLINIKTLQPTGQQRQLNILYGAGFDSNYGNFIRPESRASINYTEFFNENLSVSAGLTHQLNNFAWESLGIGYNVADFGNGNIDVIEGISPSLSTNERNNLGGHIVLNYKPAAETNLYFNSYFNSSRQNITRHSLSMSANGDWINQSETGEAGRRGTYGYDVYLQDQLVQQVMAQAGAKHRLNEIELDFKLGWSYGSMREDQISLPFQLSGLDYTINMNDQARPTMAVIDREIRSQDLRIEPMNEVVQQHVESTFTGNIDINVPMGQGFFQVGSGAIISSKDGDFRDTIFRALGLVNLASFQLDEGKTISVLESDDYMIPWYIKPDNARRYFEYNLPSFRSETALQHENSDIWNYGALEGIYSGYGMFSWYIGLFNITGGARVEHTNAEYKGNNVLFNEIGFFDSTTDTTVNNSYTNLFPNLQLKIEPTEQSVIQAAYSRSIARQNFYDITPFRLVHHLNSTIFRGNPDLDPMISDNLDLLLGHNIGNMGHLNLGLFYKNISNFVIERIRTVEGGAFDGYTERTFEIGDETAQIFGIEAAWQQGFGFLPGILGNLGTYVNYTWSHSEFDAEFRDDDVRMPGQSPHVVNAALNYRQGRFTGQVAYHWTAESIVRLAEEPTPAPSAGGQIYRDRYEDGARDLSVTARFRISDNFRLWADATNLLKDERIQFTRSRSMYPVETDFRRSSVFRIGLRFDL